MTITTNKRFVKTLKATQIFIFLLMGASVVFLLTLSENDSQQSWNYIILIIAAYLFFNVFLYLKQYTFLEVEKDPSFLILKFYNTFFLSAGKRKIRIPVASLIKYEIHKGTFHDNLVLYVNTRNGLAKYPPISLSGYPKPKVDKLTSFLDSLIANRSGK